VHPTIEVGRDWTNEKLERSIEPTPLVDRPIYPKAIRGRDASTLKRKPGRLDHHHFAVPSSSSSPFPRPREP